MSLTNKTAFITGGCKNLGALIATTLAKEGANLALHYNSASAKPGAEKLLIDLAKTYPKQHFRIYQADLTTASSVSQIYASIAHDFPAGLDIVVNTVGKVLKKPMVDISEEEYDTMFAVNSKAAFLITQAAAQHVRPGGKIINIVTALLGAYTGFYTSYQGSKAPVEWFTKGLSKELMPRGISVNAIAPGPMDTPFFYAQETEEAVEFHKSQGIGGRLTKIEDVAPIVRFLCEERGWINGECLVCDQDWNCANGLSRSDSFCEWWIYEPLRVVSISSLILALMVRHAFVGGSHDVIHEIRYHDQSRLSLWYGQSSPPRS